MTQQIIREAAMAVSFRGGRGKGLFIKEKNNKKVTTAIKLEGGGGVRP